MRFDLKKIITVVLALVLSVSTFLPERVFAEGNGLKEVVFNGITESGVEVEATVKDKDYSEDTVLEAGDVYDDAFLSMSKAKLKLENIEVIAVNISLKDGDKAHGKEALHNCEVSFKGLKENAKALLYVKDYNKNRTEKIEFVQSGNTVSFKGRGSGTYIVVYEAPAVPVVFESDVKTEAAITVVDETNAFAEGTVMKAKDVAVSEVNDLVEGDVVYAVDISFKTDGQEVEPDGDVTVTIALDLDPTKSLKLVHIADDGTVTDVDNAVFTADGVTFVASSFSTYAIVDKDNKTITTIHWGEIKDGAWSEFDAATLDQSVGSVSIDATYPGYVYIDAVYYASAQTLPNIDHSSADENRTFINRILTKVTAEDETYTWTAEDALNNAEVFTLAVGSHIYVVYEVPAVTPTPSPEPTPDVDGPTTEKNVTPNGDGTYTIQLDITGTIHQEVHQTGANVIIIYDISQSMSQNVGGMTRLEASRQATHTLIDTLKPGTNDIDLALITFAQDAQTRSFSGSNWTKNGSNITSIVDGITNVGQNLGTSWHEALDNASDLTPPDDDPTYVIFITDGCPSVNGLTSSGHSHGAAGTNNTTDLCYTAALAYAKILAGTKGQSYSSTVTSGNRSWTISGNGKGYNLYGIYTGTDSNNMLGQLVTAANGKQTITATSADAIKTAFQNIAQTIVDNLGSNNVVVDDGIPSITSVSASVSGAAGGFEYYRSGGTVKDEETGETSEKYDHTANGGLGETWSDAPGASYTQENGVVWDMSKVGVVEDGVTYTLRFTVWPSQEAYDLIADVNNAVVRAEDGSVTQYETADEAFSHLDDTLKSYLYKNSADGKYYLKTNTHLKTSYSYNGTAYTDIIDEGENAMVLAAEPISLKKNWPSNFLDEYGAAQYRDENGNVQTATEIKLTVVRSDGTTDSAGKLVYEDYLDVTVGKDNNWESGDLYISCGVMVVKNGTVDIKEPGFDYTITEPEGFSYYWDLIADVYHPMVINGTSTMLILDDSLASVDNVNSFEINGHKYKKGSDHNTLEGSNYRRSNLNLTKVVKNGEDTVSGGIDDYFTYKVVVKDSNSSDGYVWFSAWDPTLEYTDEETGEIKHGGTYKGTDWIISGATAETGNTGYWYATNGAEVQFKIKAGWNVRFLNLYHDTTYSFEEILAEDSDYQLDKVEGSVRYDFMDESINVDDWFKVDETNSKKVSGTIIEPNNQYTVTYTNKCDAFYVYHSGVAGDGNLEVVLMPKNGGTYDLTQNVTEGTLYGGYYMDYAGKGSYADDGVAKDDGVVYSGWNYTWTDPETTKGTEITPVVGETYYIKEVPVWFLRNYYQINYLKTSQELTGLYLISDVDDLNYDETGFILTKEENGVNIVAKVNSTITVKNTATNKTVTLKPSTVFKSIGVTSDDCYLTLLNVTEDPNYFAADTTFSMKPYWVTPDGIEVSGIKTRTITITDLVKSGISKTED
ncbi:MAG: VWA domain-containing protein [Erysipelotrichaceae bacterium]|nr:VWA domain-containing protein [Erysipelotrichaceae bacterium]